MIGVYIHEYPKHVQEGREIGAAVDGNSSPGSFSGSYKSDSFSSLLAIQLAVPHIYRQLGHSTMFGGNLAARGVMYQTATLFITILNVI